MKIHLEKSYGVRADNSMKTWIQLFRTYNKVRAKESAYIQSFGLTMNQFQVLEVLYHRGDMNIGTITKLTMGTPGNVTVVVRNLKRDGWISSVADLKDKRASILSITQKGRDIIEKLFPGHAKNFEEYFEVLDEDETETLFKLLRKLNKSL
ncbi:MarR family winged helix-turn-helix transcriptional regulator [Sulfurimonas sp. HSL3-2]|uniref:MarR family winged helix-turn-helix transcriptional regulator n=1 Tax=Hydrocurvibacter mobilis TaxID=3131936 RepID=UPI0031F8155B